MNANYDRIAGIYDPLSRVIFGKAQVRAQVELLHAIKPGARVLLVGGGTGWILEEIAKLQSTSLQLVYVDNSAKMIEIASKKNFGQNQISFVVRDILAFGTAELFDTIITPFLFDNFKDEMAATVFNKLDKILVENGNWLYTDFSKTSSQTTLWQRILLKTMYRFFNTIASVSTDQLPEMQSHFNRNQYRTVFKSTHYGGFIEGIIYQKSTDRRAVSPE